MINKYGHILGHYRSDQPYGFQIFESNLLNPNIWMHYLTYTKYLDTLSILLISDT